MDFIKNDYREEITSQSRKELESLARWQYDNYGSWPVIIGGWAVWSYYSNGYGSRDIDLILPSNNKITENMIKNYFPDNGIKEYPDSVFSQTVHYRKPIQIADGTKDDIIFDMLSADKPRPDPEDLGVYVDWNWADQYGNDMSLGNVFIKIPEPELLIPLKIIGAVARTRYMRTQLDTAYIRSKIWKDYYDVAVLTNNLDLSMKKMKFHWKNTRLTNNLRNEFLDGYISRSDVLQEANSRYPKISGNLPILKRKKKKRSQISTRSKRKDS